MTIESEALMSIKDNAPQGAEYFCGGKYLKIGDSYPLAFDGSKWVISTSNFGSNLDLVRLK